MVHRVVHCVALCTERSIFEIQLLFKHSVGDNALLAKELSSLFHDSRSLVVNACALRAGGLKFDSRLGQVCVCFGCECLWNLSVNVSVNVESPTHEKS